jgi:hypothetical protein
MTLLRVIDSTFLFLGSLDQERQPRDHLYDQGGMNGQLWIGVAETVCQTWRPPWRREEILGYQQMIIRV